MSIDLDRRVFDGQCKFTGFKPHPAQAEVLDAFFGGQRFVAPVFGRQSGKTLLSAHLFAFAMSQPGKLIWAAAPTYDGCQRIWHWLYPVVSKMFGSKLKILNSKPASMSLPWDTVIEFRSLDRPDTNVGVGLDFLGWDEPALTKGGKHIWQIQLRPTLAARLGQCLMTTTPRGHDWFHDLVHSDEWWMRQYPSHCNPHLQRSELDAMKREMDEIVYKQEVLAQFVAFAGIVYSMFDMERHVVDDNTAWDITRGWADYIACDPGLNNTAMLHIRHNKVTGEDMVMRDVMLSNKLFDDALNTIKQWQPAEGFEGYICDIAGRQRGQQTGQSFVGWMKEHGVKFTHSNLRNTRDGINMVRGRLQNYDGEVRLTFAKAATHTVKTMLNYHFPDNKTGPEADEPVKDGIYDHHADALRYYITWQHKPRAMAIQH